MSRARIWFVVAALAGGIAPSVARSQEAASWAPGTYEIWVCRTGPCRDSTDQRLVTRGVLVIGRSSEILAGLPDSLQRALELRFTRAKANGCFDVAQQPRGAQSYAGILRQAGVAWTLADSGNGIAFELYRSPDASHEVVLQRGTDELSGRGRSSGAGMAAVTWQPDTVIARRVGPVDVALCERAALRRLEYLRYLRRPA